MKPNSAKKVLVQCDELAAVTDEPGRITRTFHSPAMQRANKLVGGWMRQAGLAVSEDAAFNLFGRWSSANPKAKTLLLGSHLDTVRDAGKYDGPLGVLVALAAVEKLKTSGVALPFHIEVVGFSDEEGVRYQTTYLGSRALAGKLTKADLALIEEKGIEKARRKAGEFLAYAEVHIEQGPVLESRNLGVGVVTAIASQKRVKVTFTGQAGHAGTTPMHGRRDALCGAAEFITAVENCGILGTVGIVEVHPGASNVIPGKVELSLDLRDQSDAVCDRIYRRLHEHADRIVSRRQLTLTWDLLQETDAVPCDKALTKLMRRVVAAHETAVVAMPSGAGHDAAVMASLCPMAMLFIRCKDGISHHPAESVQAADVAKSIDVLSDFIVALAATS
ncbi:MAG: allantoate amidohydrolase [Chthoniobacterales bacterium]